MRREIASSAQRELCDIVFASTLIAPFHQGVIGFGSRCDSHLPLDCFFSFCFAFFLFFFSWRERRRKIDHGVMSCHRGVTWESSLQVYYPRHGARVLTN